MQRGEIPPYRHTPSPYMQRQHYRRARNRPNRYEKAFKHPMRVSMKAYTKRRAQVHQADNYQEDARAGAQPGMGNQSNQQRALAGMTAELMAFDQPGMGPYTFKNKFTKHLRKLPPEKRAKVVRRLAKAGTDQNAWQQYLTEQTQSTDAIRRVTATQLQRFQP